MMSRMTARAAKPDRYLVDKVGTPDPETSEYFVLDIVGNWQHREALSRLGGKYRERRYEQLAKECFDALDATHAAHAEVMEARNPKKKGGGKKEVARP